jgi:hypothetical protein
MVDVTNMRAKQMVDTEVISPDVLPEGELEVTRAEKVAIKTGVSAGQEKLVLELKKGDKMYSWFPNKTSIGSMIDRFGSGDTDKWIGKKVKLSAEQVMVQGKKKKMITLA